MSFVGPSTYQPRTDPIKNSLPSFSFGFRPPKSLALNTTNPGPGNYSIPSSLKLTPKKQEKNDLHKSTQLRDSINETKVRSTISMKPLTPIETHPGPGHYDPRDSKFIEGPHFSLISSFFAFILS